MHSHPALHAVCFPTEFNRFNMTTVGIEVGYQTSLVASPIGGGIDVLQNEYSQRTTAYVHLF
jgi:hypothetical protein